MSSNVLSWNSFIMNDDRKALSDIEEGKKLGINNGNNSDDLLGFMSNYAPKNKVNYSSTKNGGNNYNNKIRIESIKIYNIYNKNNNPNEIFISLKYLFNIIEYLSLIKYNIGLNIEIKCIISNFSLNIDEFDRNNRKHCRLSLDLDKKYRIGSLDNLFLYWSHGYIFGLNDIYYGRHKYSIKILQEIKRRGTKIITPKLIIGFITLNEFKKIKNTTYNIGDTIYSVGFDINKGIIKTKQIEIDYAKKCLKGDIIYINFDCKYARNNQKPTISIQINDKKYDNPFYKFDSFSLAKGFIWKFVLFGKGYKVQLLDYNIYQ